MSSRFSAVSICNQPIKPTFKSLLVSCTCLIPHIYLFVIHCISVFKMILGSVILKKVSVLATGTCMNKILFFLIVAAELGDYDAAEHLSNYVHEVKCLPQLNDVKAQAIADIHKTLVYVHFLSAGFKLNLTQFQSCKRIFSGHCVKRATV
jgi:hypothetical protein